MKSSSRLFVIFFLTLICILSLFSCGKEAVSARFIADGIEYVTLTADSASDFALPPEPVKDGYVFSGWHLGEGADSPRFTTDSLLPGETVTVYAVWTEIHVHSESEIKVFKAPTCFDDGIAYTECTVCGYNMSTCFIPSTPHVPSDWKIDTPSTCTEAGLMHKECTRCGTVTETQDAPLAPHVEGAEQTAVEPTCLVDGEAVIKCAECDALLSTRKLSSYGHSEREIPPKAPTETLDGFTAGVECSRCFEVLTPPVRVPAEISGCEIIIADAVLDGAAFTKITASGVEKLSLDGMIKINDEATYTVSRDMGGTDVIEGGTLPLAVGENTYYIKVSFGDDSLVYTLSIYRRRVVTVTFVTEGSAVEPISVDEGEVPQAIPVSTLLGYDFVGWDIDLSLPLTEDKSTSAIFAPRDDTPYTVVYYILNGDKYTEHHRETLTGTTDTPAVIPDIAIEHYTVNREMSEAEGLIRADGGLVLSLYLDPVKYTVSFKTGIALDIPSVSVTALTPYSPPTLDDRAEHRFDGWYYNGARWDGTDSMTEDIALVAKWVRVATVVFDTSAIEGLLIDPITADVGGTVYLDIELPKTEDMTVGFFLNGMPWVPGYNTVTRDATVICKWVKRYVTVTFNSAGNTYIGPITLEYGEIIGSVPTPERGTMYCFEGWYIINSDVEWDVSSMPVTSDLVLEARWSILTPPDIFG